MTLKNIFGCGLLAYVLVVNAVAADFGDEKILVIGCRPWDENLKNVANFVYAADFIDFYNGGAPSPIPKNYFHYDLNDNKTFSARNFSDFAKENAEKYFLIIIDWATYQHVRRQKAWADFRALLKDGGTLIVPVLYYKMSYGSRERIMTNYSRETAEKLTEDNLKQSFDKIEIISYDQIPADSKFEILRRHENSRSDKMAELADAVVVFATKLSHIKTSARKSPQGQPKNPGVQIPSLAHIKEKLLLGDSIVCSDTHVFGIQSILGSFMGFTAEALLKGFDVELGHVRYTRDKVFAAIFVRFDPARPRIILILRTTL